MGRNTNYRQDFTISDFYCVECGQKGLSCARRNGQSREPGHLKKLFCQNCGRETNHVEIRPYGKYTKENFDEEFYLGRFVDGQRIPLCDLLKCSNANCEYNRNNRCWNSNYSYSCKHRIEEEKNEEINDDGRNSRFGENNICS